MIGIRGASGTATYTRTRADTLTHLICLAFIESRTKQYDLLTVQAEQCIEYYCVSNAFPAEE